MGAFFAPCEREPESETYRAHKVAFVVGARGHKLKLRGRDRGVVSRRERSSTMARGGADAPPINATYCCDVTFRVISYVYPPRSPCLLVILARSERYVIKLVLRRDTVYGTSPRIDRNAKRLPRFADVLSQVHVDKVVAKLWDMRRVTLKPS